MEEYKKIISEKFRQAEEMMDKNDPNNVEYFKILEAAREKHKANKKRKESIITHIFKK